MTELDGKWTLGQFRRLAAGVYSVDDLQLLEQDLRLSLPSFPPALLDGVVPHEHAGSGRASRCYEHGSYFPM